MDRAQISPQGINSRRCGGWPAVLRLLALIGIAIASCTVADIPLKAQPESFQLDSTTKQIFVNLPRSVGGSIDPNDCDLKGTTLPQSVGGWLDLRGCNLDGIDLPQSVGRSRLDRGDFLNQFEKRKIRAPLWSP